MEPHRQYHTLHHILKMLEHAQMMDVKLTMPMCWAIWCHDVIYDPKATAGDNEAESAEFCAYFMEEFGIADKYVEQAKRLILATAKIFEPGIPELVDEEQWAICGLDIYGLANRCSAEKARYQIREEYAHMSEEDWVQNRAGFLQMLLDKEYLIHPTFFKSMAGFETWHEAARRNIEDELMELL
jgi:predicted metal-dependent HD superfamily phosphohydrolase